MPYGEGYTEQELADGAAMIEARKVESWIVEAPGLIFTAGTEVDAELVASKFPGATMRKAS